MHDTIETPDDAHVQSPSFPFYSKYNLPVFMLTIFVVVPGWVVAFIIEWVCSTFLHHSAPIATWVSPIILTGITCAYAWWSWLMQKQENSKYLTALDEMAARMEELDKRMDQPVLPSNVALFRRKDGAVVPSQGSH